MACSFSFSKSRLPILIVSVLLATVVLLTAGRYLKSAVQAAQWRAELLRWPHCTALSVQPSLVTVVTSMIVLPIGRSKHETKYYERWFNNTLRSVSAPLVLFLSGFPGGEARIRELRGSLPIHIISVADAWELPRAMEFRAEYEGPQRLLDFEKNIHSPELYAIWNGKSKGKNNSEQTASIRSNLSIFFFLFFFFFILFKLFSHFPFFSQPTCLTTSVQPTHSARIFFFGPMAAAFANGLSQTGHRQTASWRLFPCGRMVCSLA